MRRLSTALALAALGLVLVAAPVEAHSELISISPANGAQLGAAPATVVLTFDEPVQVDGTSVVVTAPDGATVSTGPALVRGTTLTQRLSPLTEQGRYTVGYRITSEDGHPVSASRTFSLKTGATPATAAPAARAATLTTATSTSSSGGSRALIVVLAVVALLLVGSVGVVGARRRTT